MKQQEPQLTLSHFNKTFDNLGKMVKQGFDAVDKRFEKVDEQLYQHDARFQKLEGKLEEHDARFQKLEDGQERIVRRLDNAVFQAQHERLQHRVEKLEEKTGLKK